MQLPLLTVRGSLTRVTAIFRRTQGIGVFDICDR